MSHIHFPDGILPAELWLGGYILTAFVIAAMWWLKKPKIESRRFALLGIMSAIMILVMALEIPPFSYHFNLSVAAGIILGPRLSVLAALIVNLILALIGHGGITVVGLNTLVLCVEMLTGYYIFRGLTRLHVDLWKSAFLATLVGLALGGTLGFGVIASARDAIDRFLFYAGRPGQDIGPGISGTHLSLTRLALIMFGIGSIGWILESLLSAAVLSYLGKAYPDIIGRPVHEGERKGNS